MASSMFPFSYELEGQFTTDFLIRLFRGALSHEDTVFTLRSDLGKGLSFGADIVDGKRQFFLEPISDDCLTESGEMPKIWAKQHNLKADAQAARFYTCDIVDAAFAILGAPNAWFEEKEAQLLGFENAVPAFIAASFETDLELPDFPLMIIFIIFMYYSLIQFARFEFTFKPSFGNFTIIEIICATLFVVWLLFHLLLKSGRPKIPVTQGGEPEVLVFYKNQKRYMLRVLPLLMIFAFFTPS